MAQGQVTKVYQLRTLGYDELSKQLDDVTKKFEAIKKAKLASEGKLALASDTAEVKKYTDEILKLKIAEQEARTERQKLLTEQKASQLVRQEEIRQRREEKQATDAAAGSYAALYKEYRELYNLVKQTPANNALNFRGQTLQFDEAINKLKQLAAAEQDFRRQFQRDSLLVGEYTSGIVQAFKQMGLDDLVGGQITQAQARLKELDTTFEQLKQELSEIKVTGEGSLQAIEKELIDNRKEAIELNKNLNGLQQEFRGVGDIGNQISVGLSNGLKQVKNQVGQLILSYVGIQAAFQGILSSVDNAKELADQTTSLEIELGKAAGGADKLVESLAGLDTRTKLTVLEEIANIAARAGVAESELVGVTQAIDQIKIAFGKDFGDVEQGTESLVKLVNIFLGPGEVSGDNLLRMGNAIRTLANESVASVPFLNDFSQRMAGLKGISDISLPAVLGLASGFEQFGQSAETSSTALVKIIPKLATDTAKYAQIAGMTRETFATLLESNPAEALLAVSESLVKSSEGIEGVSAAFADSELGSGRIASVLGVLGKNADEFRKSIDSAGTSFNDTGNIANAFAAKNNNLAATLDKISKKFADAAGSKAFQVTLVAIATVISALINSLPLLITLLGSYAAIWAVANTAMIRARLSTLALTVATQAKAAAIVVSQTVIRSYTAVVTLLSTAMGRAAVTSGVLATAIKLLSGPMGIVLATFSLLLISIKAIATATNEYTRAQRIAAQETKLSNQIARDARTAIADQVNQVKLLTDVVTDLTLTENTRNKAMQDLIAIDPRFREALDGQKVNFEKLNAIVKEYNENLLRKAKLEGAQKLLSENTAALSQLEADRTILELSKKGIISDNAKDVYDKYASTFGKSFAPIQLASSAGDAERLALEAKNIIDPILKEIDKKIAEQAEVAEAVQNIVKKNYEEVHKVITSGSAAGPASAAANVEVDVQKMQVAIKALNEQIDNFRGSQAELNNLIARRDALQAQLNKRLGAAGAAGASSLTGAQKDLFKDINAERDLLIAEEELKRAQNVTSEEVYLQNILAINQKAIDDKLNLLKGSTAEERKIIADLSRERITLERDTNNKIFQERLQFLKSTLEAEISDIRAQDRLVQEDPTASYSAKAQSKLGADKAILALQEKYAIDLDKAERELGQQSIKNAMEAAEAVKKIKADIAADNIALLEASLKDIQAAGNQSTVLFKSILAKRRLDVLESGATPGKKEEVLAALDEEEKTGILSREVSNMQEQLPIYKQLLEQKRITDTQYLAFVTQLDEKQAELMQSLSGAASGALKNITDIKGLLQNSVRDVFSIKINTGVDKVLSDTIAQTYDLALSAMNNYFDAKSARIKQDAELELQNLEQEKQRALDRAQSNEEKLRIEKKFKAEEDRINREAFEKHKKQQIAQAAVNLGIQLSNLAVIAFAPNPLNIATLGTAGAVMYAIQAALALANFALNVSQIKRAKFEQGGVPGKGGKFGGQPHSKGGTPFTFKGQEFEAEVDELAVIRTRNAPRNKIFQAIGTQAQIASAMNAVGGGVNFEPGAKLKRFDYGGSLGESLRPPVFTPAGSTVINQGHGISEEKFDELLTTITGLANEQSARIDRIEVLQVTNTVTTAQRKQVKQSQIGTL